MRNPLRRAVSRWFANHGRDLPWRRTNDPYAILVSELMLQQTQVSRVIPKYHAFLRRFPTAQSLASAPLRDVLAAWSGLGYNRRAKYLWEAAKAVVAQFRGNLPRDVEELRSLPGIGRYTAGAIASFAFGARAAAVDTNVSRVLSRAVLGVERAPDVAVWRAADALVPKDAARWNHALMDIGALYCGARPQCAACPLRRACLFKRGPARGGTSEHRRNARLTRAACRAMQRSQPYEGSRRQHRGRVIRALASVRTMSVTRLGAQVKEGFGKSDLPWLYVLLDDLEREGLVALNTQRTRVALP